MRGSQRRACCPGYQRGRGRFRVPANIYPDDGGVHCNTLGENVTNGAEEIEIDRIESTRQDLEN